MTEREAFIRGIAENLYDDTPRLAFADWLDEHGEHDRAEFIRVQVELEPIRDRYEIPRAAELHAREKQFGCYRRYTREAAQKWLGKMPKAWDDWQKGITIEFRRGFPDTLALPARTFLEVGAQIRERHPTIRRVVLFRVNGYGERVAMCPALSGLSELELACWYSDNDARAIAASPHLNELGVLELWLARQVPLRDSQLCRIAASGKAWPKLHELVLLNPYDEMERTRKRLVTVANKAAERKVAVYRCGFSGLYPFAADFWYAFPGHLPDGRAALALEDPRTSPPSLCVLTFDKRGRQTEDVIYVPFPAELCALREYEYARYEHVDRQRQHLIDTIGLQPGFIRIQDCRFPGDAADYNRPCPDIPNDFGVPDTDDEESWNTWPTGNGGNAWRNVRNGEWVFGWDRYGDNSGHIHST
ncbi:TIGR02996 domain-containing protein [Gemmata sp. JC717]|uniref:TIGR02996 domain-containing protein n=1 Tax=Gemmata algarum TaxID=2975278 RepID=UPI0021BAAE0B|nr:TIGR02996 domain-containing protein [Gemmata algarum]MDY3555796.1 TIGR02996 domain-containing protein [Gemmata algarum]